MTDFSAWLDGTAARVFALCATLFIVVNAAAVALVLATRDRALVNRWTARWLAANLILVGGGLGVPIAAKVVRLAVDAVAATHSITPLNESEREAAAEQQPPSRR